MALTTPRERYEAAQKRVEQILASKDKYITGTAKGKPAAILKAKALKTARANLAKASKAYTPADRWANTAVDQQLAPLREEETLANNSFTDAVGASDRLTAGVQGEYGKLATAAQQGVEQQLANVAQRTTGNAEQVGRSLDFLKDVFGSGGQVDTASIDGGTGAVNSAAAQDAGLASEIALRGKSQAGDFGMFQGIAGVANAEYQAGARTARDRALAEIARKRTDLKAQIPLLVRQYRTEDRDYALRKDALELDATGQQIADENADADRAAAESAAAASAAADKAEANAGNSPRQRTLKAVAALNGAIAKANAVLGSPDGNAQIASTALREIGLRGGAGGDYTIEGKKLRLTPTGVARYFTAISGMPQNNAFYAIKLYDPRLTGGNGFKLVKGSDGKMHLYHPQLVRWG